MLGINFKKSIICFLTTLAFSFAIVVASSILCANEAQAQFGPGNYSNMYMPGGAASSSTKKSTSTTTTTTSSSTSTKSSTSGKKGQVFGTLIGKGSEIFVGLRDIIFAVSGFGIVAVAIGGFFGNLNYKWLAAIGIGLFVISTTAAIIDYMVGQRPGSFEDVQEALQTGS